MKTLLLYLLQVVIVSGILYAYYHIALRNKKFHQYNRFYMLFATVVSILIPFLNIPVYFTGDDNPAQWMSALQNLSGDPVIITIEAEEAPSIFTWANLLYTFYVLVSLVGLIKITVSIRRLKKIMRQHPAEHLNGIRLINTAEPGTPFSFFRWLFWNKDIELASAKGEQIFRHEVFHIEQKHSFDTVFMEMITIVFWVNPFFHLMKKELKAIHEFLADQFATDETRKWEYAEMLLMQALNTRHSLVHPFFHNQIKRRIAMITNPQKTSHQYLRKLLVLPLAALLVTLFAFSYKQIQEEKSPPEIPMSESLVTLAEGSPTKASNKVMLATYKEIKQAGTKDTVPAQKPVMLRLTGSATGTEARPLLIVNGVETSDKDYDKTLSDLNPNSIESVTVLKGSGADSIYGPKGKNGVLLIQTKQGQPLTLQQVESSKEVEVTGYARKADVSSLVKVDTIESTAPRLRLELRKPNDTTRIISDEVVVTGYASSKAEGGRIKAVTADNSEQKVVTVVGRPSTRTVNSVTATGAELDVEPSFPGGAAAWYSFLSKNLDVKTAQKKGAPEGQYTVQLSVKVGKDGKLSVVKALTNHGYGMEEAAIRALEKSPYWNPGYKNNEAVGAYKVQPITFNIVSSKSINTSTEAAADNSLSVYPNPVKDQLSLQFTNKKSRNVVVRIFDVAGKERSTANLSLSKGQVTSTISTASLEPGTYVLRVDGKGEGKPSSFKFVKE